MKKFVAVTLVAGFFASVAATSTPANAAVAAKCGDRAKLVKILKTNYKEVPVALGISQRNTEAFEIFASDSGSWTVMMTKTNGQTCIMAAGHSWRDLPKQLADIQS